MWSLPDINLLNARAAAEASKLKRAARRGPGKRQQCEYYGCQSRAVESVPWFDIFGDDPKGLVHVCSEHPADSVGEMFTCEACGRLMVDHYTWERYAVDRDGITLCLKCAADQHFGDAANWLDPRAVKQVVLEPNGLPLFDPKTGVLNVARCRHVLGVKQPLPAGIEFFDNAEFDNCDGHQICGDDLFDIIKRLNQPFCPGLDAAYQLSVSIGIYIPGATESRQKSQAA